MRRVLGISRTIASLLVIEFFVPGGTLIVLAILFANRPGLPILSVLGRRCPAVLSILSRVTGNSALSNHILARQ